MRVLMLTQKVDDYDPISEFTVEWIEKHRKRVEELFAIASFVGVLSYLLSQCDTIRKRDLCRKGFPLKSML